MTIQLDLVYDTTCCPIKTTIVLWGHQAEAPQTALSEILPLMTNLKTFTATLFNTRPTNKVGLCAHHIDRYEIKELLDKLPSSVENLNVDTRGFDIDEAITSNFVIR